MEGLKTLKKALIVIVMILLGTLVIPPIFKYFNTIEPWVLGMPFLVFWVVFINIAIAVILLILWFIDSSLEGEDEI